MSEITPNTPNPVREDAYVEELATKLGIDPQYIPKSPVWRNEEEIRAIAEMFANMSGSSGGGVLVVHETVSGGTHTLDKTWQEIHDFSGISVVISDTPDGDGTLRKFDSVITLRDDPTYVVTTWDAIEYTASSASGYPAYSE